jgi:hypothetical protein
MLVPDRALNALLLAEVLLVLDVLATEGLLRQELIVRSAENPQVFRIVATAQGSRLGVIQLQKRSRLAATAVDRDIRASYSVALEDLTARCR